MTPTRPYLLRAIYEWLVDNHLTPQIVVNATLPGVQVPAKYIENGKIVLNIGSQAVRKLVISNERVEFEARFTGTTWQIIIPIAAVLAIYAQENGHGMAFGEEDMAAEEGSNSQVSTESASPAAKSSKPQLKIVK